MRLLITGGNGLIGSFILNNYSNIFEKIFCLGRKKINCFEFIKQDLRFSIKSSLPEVDVVLHLAANTGIYNTENNIIKSHKVNISGTIHLLEALKFQKNPPFFIFFGSATQVGYTDTKSPVNTDRKDIPITIYDLTKLSAENYLLNYIQKKRIRGCSLRLCNVYGGLRENQSSDRGIIDKVFFKALAGETITIYNNGSYIRDYIYIEDVVRAILKTLKNQNKVNGKKFFIGSGKGMKIKDAFYTAIKVAQSMTKKEPKVSFLDNPSALSLIEKRSFVANIDNFTNCTKWKPKYSLETGLIKSYF